MHIFIQVPDGLYYLLLELVYGDRGLVIYCSQHSHTYSHFQYLRTHHLSSAFTHTKPYTGTVVNICWHSSLRVAYRTQCCGTVTIYYGSGSSSGSDFRKVMVPVPVPTFEKLWFWFLLLKKLRFRFRFRFRIRFQLHI
jgi:hypothetical protein